MFFETIKNLPRININIKCGYTDYIDFLQWNEVTEPAMYGIDCYNREFIVVKFIINKDSKNPIKLMQTFFQRYTNGYKWMGCGHATDYLIFTIGGMNEFDFNFLNKILNGETVEIDNSVSSHFKGDKVSLFNEKEWKASTVIQKNWKICRYNPKYKMCETVQTRNLEMICQYFIKHLLMGKNYLLI